MIGKITVKNITIIVRSHGKSRKLHRQRGDQFARDFWMVKRVIEISAIFRIEHIVEKRRILALNDIETVATIFRILHIIPDALLAIHIDHIAIDSPCHTHILPNLGYLRDRPSRTEIQFLEAFFIGLLRMLLIENHIFFIPLVDREHTMLAAFAIEAKCTVATILKIHRMTTSVAIVALDARIAES